MTTSKQDPAFDPETEWLDHVRPTGLVVAKAILKELGATPLRQTALDSEVVKAKLTPQGTLGDPWTFFRDLLDWPATHVAGIPGGPAFAETLSVSLPEHETVLAPTWAVRKADNADGFQLLVSVLPAGIDPDHRGVLPGWEASGHQRFERLLRETQVFTGLLLSDKSLRLVHAPAGETSGWLAFPLDQLGSVAGRPMLGGLKLLLNRASLFTNPENKRLPALLKASREAQAGVSQELAAQVLGALHELLRGLHAADRAAIEALAQQRPGHLYEGLLTVLMRLVFLLYAEDRDLLPSHTDADSRALYENYSVRDLLARLSDHEAQNPDTMDERRGGWGRLLALFRLIHAGDRSGWIVARGGKLFDPDAFPFLEGRAAATGAPRVLAVSDGCVLRILRGLMILRAEGLSYRGLDVEQIGSVYETVMGFTVETAAGPSLAIKAGKNNRTPVFVDCAALVKLAPDARQRHIKEATGRANLPAKTVAAIKAAMDAEGIVAALGEIVDERGSPGHAPAPAGAPLLQPTDERRRTGSHYTPRSLTEPIVRQALMPALERLGPDATPAQILDLKVCDPAMGSGAFLVEACRQLGQRLVQAWGELGPKPEIPADEDEELHARRLVAQRCLYGVDRNPMATDLARLSLWLATLAREHEFTFLDHALKTGDSLIGLTRAQIAALHWDSGPGHAVMRALVRDRLNEVLQGRNEIRAAPDDVTRATQERRHREIETRLERLRQSADAVVSAFFSTDKPTPRETRRAEIESWFAGETDIWPKVAAAAAELQYGRHPVRPFHWEIEFPEAFEGGHPGFDAMVGNPPFAGKNTTLKSNREGILDWLKTLHLGAHGNADYVAHFFRRAWNLIHTGGAFGLIATNTIGQGDTRETGLSPILREGGTIFAARRRLPWPGEAAVVVSVVHVGQQLQIGQPNLDGKPVRRISAYLVEGDLDESPKPLAANAGKAFIGSYVLGMGFTFDDDGAGDDVGQPTSLAEMRRLIAANPSDQGRIFPYIGGEEINNDPQQRAHRFVIDFDALPLDEVRRRWPELLKLVEAKVRPHRMKQASIVNPERWWMHARSAGNLSAAMVGLQRVLAMARVTPQLSIAVLPAGMVYAETVVVFPLGTSASFSVLQSRAHEVWARFFSSSMKDDLRYAPSDCFETFVLPPGLERDSELNVAGEAYNRHRAKLMVTTAKGLTATYNRFHDPNDKAPDIVELRRLHDEMDRAVLRAYGWDDLAKQAKAEHLTAATEDDPKYQGRLFWPAAPRGEALARLLDLNAERASVEAAAGAATVKASSKAKKAAKRKGFAENQRLLL